MPQPLCVRSSSQTIRDCLVWRAREWMCACVSCLLHARLFEWVNKLMVYSLAYPMQCHLIHSRSHTHTHTHPPSMTKLCSHLRWSVTDVFRRWPHPNSCCTPSPRMSSGVLSPSPTESPSVRRFIIHLIAFVYSADNRVHIATPPPSHWRLRHAMGAMTPGLAARNRSIRCGAPCLLRAAVSIRCGREGWVQVYRVSAVEGAPSEREGAVLYINIRCRSRHCPSECRSAAPRLHNELSFTGGGVGGDAFVQDACFQHPLLSAENNSPQAFWRVPKIFCLFCSNPLFVMNCLHVLCTILNILQHLIWALDMRNTRRHEKNGFYSLRIVWQSFYSSMQQTH